MNKIPCVCGHFENVHNRETRAQYAHCSTCMDIYFNALHFTKQYHLHNYISDNLTFIEQLAKERNLI